jgi:hypothetical protein
MAICGHFSRTIIQIGCWQDQTLTQRALVRSRQNWLISIVSSSIVIMDFVLKYGSITAAVITTAVMCGTVGISRLRILPETT